MTKPTRARSKHRAETAVPDAHKLDMYRLMYTSRRLDDIEIALKRQNLIYFQISCAGHEATLAAAAMHLRPGHDWFFPYYRDRTLCLGLGMTPLELLMQGVGAADCPASGGRQMPSHWGHKDFNIVSEASTTGTQYLSAVGCAEAGRFWQRPQAPRGHSFAADEVVYCSSGEGATSQGVFFEALNTACMDALPVLFHIEDNGWAISTPVERQTAGGSISKLLAAYPNLLRLEFDGCCPIESYGAWASAVAYARARKGPVLLHAHVVRPYSHSLSDDEKLYRSQEDLARQTARDPLPTYRARLLGELPDGTAIIEALEAEVEALLLAAKDAALTAAPPEGASATRYVFSEVTDPTSAIFDVPAQSVGEDKTMVDLINVCLRDEMARDGRIVVFGEDVADVSREKDLPDVKGKGGVFKVTHGLQRQFGAERVFNTPLAEANIVGRAFGMALRGMKPVVEIQFFDYIWPAMMQLRSEVVDKKIYYCI